MKRKSARRKKIVPAPDMDYRLLATVFALSGFAALSYELYWTRALQHFLGNSTYAFSAMLTTFLLGLALGAWVGGLWADRTKYPGRLLGWTQVLVGVSALASAVLVWRWLPGVERTEWLSGRHLSWGSYLARRFAVAFSVVILPTLFIGMTFPVANRIAVRRLDKLGQAVGSLYYANTIGAILGSLMAGFLLLPLLGARSALVATGILNVTVGLVSHLGNRRRGRFDSLVTAGIITLLLFAVPFLTTEGNAILSDSQDASDRVLFDAQDHTGDTKVYRKPAGDLHMSVDGHHIGGTEPDLLGKEKILAHLPMVLRPDARRVLAIGLGSGVTLGTLGLYKDLEQLHCVEIVPGVVEGARLFSAENGSILADPRLSLRVGDGVQYLLVTRERFDIISSDSKLNPEYSGNAPLLSRDYYELCRDRLTEDGVMVQWLGTHFPVRELEIIIRGFVQAFVHTGVYWYNPSSIVIAGSKSPLVMDMAAARRFAVRMRLGEDLARLELDDPYAMASLWVSGGESLTAMIGDGPTTTWQRPLVEFSIGRSYREKSRSDHEADTFRWLLRLRDPSSQSIIGEYDTDRYHRYLASAQSMLEGFSLGGLAGLHRALIDFKQAADRNPDDPRLAKLIHRLEQVESGIEASLARNDLNTADRLVRAGLLRQEQGRHREALDLFERALALHPDDVNILYNRLLSLKGAGRADQFRRGLSDFLAAFPDDARGQTLLGRELGDTELAVRAFERAVELDPENPIYLNNLATQLARLGRDEEAARAFEAVCEMDPHFANAAFFAAATYSTAGMVQESAKWARFCIDEGLVTADRFATAAQFANLRNSVYWDSVLGDTE